MENDRILVHTVKKTLFEVACVLHELLCYELTLT